METHLGVTTCSKCREPMEKGQNTLVVAKGTITEAKDELDFQGACVRYGHLDCWDGVEDTE